MTLEHADVDTEVAQTVEHFLKERLGERKTVTPRKQQNQFGKKIYKCICDMERQENNLNK